MLDYLLNRRLRENYKKALTLQNADEINDFLSKLDESERNDLLSFGFFLLKTKKAYRNMDKVMTLISVLTAIGLLALYMFHII